MSLGWPGVGLVRRDTRAFAALLRATALVTIWLLKTSQRNGRDVFDGVDFAAFVKY